MSSTLEKWALAFLGVCALATAGGAVDVRLDADSLHYDPSLQKILAQGHVLLSRGTSHLSAQEGEARSDGSSFILRGAVSADFHEEGLTLRSTELIYHADKGGRIVASGDVTLRRGKDLLSADVVVLRSGSTPNYTARGNVRLAWEGKRLESASVSRDGNAFQATGLEHFEDRDQGFKILATTLEGHIENDTVVEVVVSGSVRLELHRTGKPVVVTGSKGIYSTQRGTVVVSGNAVAKQDGRTVRAESLVMRLDSGRIEAVGKPQLVFPIGNP